MPAWNDFIEWVSSDTGSRVITTTVIPFVAIVVAGVIGALLGRGSTRRILAHENSERQAAAVASMIEAGRSATMWSGLGSAAQAHAETEFSAADIRLRLLPINGASAAADWATHELKSMRRDSAGFSFQAEQTFVDYRDRLLEWKSRPSRARKLFALDLERFRYEDAGVDAELVEQQRRWAAEQAARESEVLAETAVLSSAPPPVVTQSVPAPVVEPEPEPERPAFVMPSAESAEPVTEVLAHEPEPTTDLWEMPAASPQPEATEALATEADAADLEHDDVEPEAEAADLEVEHQDEHEDLVDGELEPSDENPEIARDGEFAEHESALPSAPPEPIRPSWR